MISWAERLPELVGLGAQLAEDPAVQTIASVLPISADMYRLLVPLALPIWPEPAAPAASVSFPHRKCGRRRR